MKQQEEDIFHKSKIDETQLSLLIPKIVGKGYFLALASFEKLKIS